MNSALKLWSVVAALGVALVAPQWAWSQNNGQTDRSGSGEIPPPTPTAPQTGNDSTPGDAQDQQAPRSAARDLQSQYDEALQSQDQDRQTSNDRWIGVAVGDVPDILRAHLNVDPNVGVMITAVVPNSPADKAGLRQHDVITHVDENMIRSLGDLIGAIGQAEGDSVHVKWLRGGTSHELAITMEPRPERVDAADAFPVPRDFQGFNDTQRDTLRRWFESMQQSGPSGSARWRFVDPSLGSNTALPQGLSIQIQRQGDEPAQVRVQRGDEVWELTENDLEQLPEDLRPHVERMLGQANAAGGFPFESLRDLDMERLGAPNMPGLDRQFEEMNRRMEQLFDELRDFRQEQRDRELDLEPATEA